MSAVARLEVKRSARPGLAYPSKGVLKITSHLGFTSFWDGMQLFLRVNEIEPVCIPEGA